VVPDDTGVFIPLLTVLSWSWRSAGYQPKCIVVPSELEPTSKTTKPVQQAMMALPQTFAEPQGQAHRLAC